MIAEKMKGFLEGSSLIREMFEEGSRLKKIHGEENVFDFSIGNPNIAPPKEIEKAIITLVENEDPVTLHGYMSNSGYDDVKEAIANNLNERFNTDFSSNNLIMVTGAAAGLNIVLKSIINPEDEIIVFTPYFMEYGNYVNNYDGKLIEVPTDKESFLPDLESLEKAISKKTKAIIINNPNNPTGVIYPESLIKDLAKILERKQRELGICIYLISDEPYRELAYEGKSVPFISKYYDNTLIVYSYSKSLSLPGERIGYVLVPDEAEYSKDLLTVMTVANRISGFVNAPSLFQKVIARCVNLKVDLDFYDNNRKKLYEGLSKLSYEMIYPEGAFYIFLKSPLEDEFEFVKMAKKHNILLVPGSAFKSPGYVRMAYCVSESTIDNSLEKFAELMEEIKELRKIDEE